MMGLARRITAPRDRLFSPWSCFFVVTGLYLAIGMWLYSMVSPSVETTQGTYVVFGDAISRADHALGALHGSDPHLASIGFIWLPLPSILELAPVSFFRLWPDVVSSGFASTLVSAVASGGTAALIVGLGARLCLAKPVVLLLVALFVLNPMIMLYGSNGMGEGIAAPGMVGATAMLTAYFHTRRRRYVAAAGGLLAIAAASLYEAAPFGLALLLALGLYVASQPEDSHEFPRGRISAFTSLGLLLMLPSVMVAGVWLAANGLIMGDPLFFAHSRSSNVEQATGVEGLQDQAELLQTATGDVGGTIVYIGSRVWPFVLPVVALLLIRLLDGRIRTLGTVSLVALVASVPLGLIGVLIYLGHTFGGLRYFIYPLFVAAAWGLYEIAQSPRPRRAVALACAGWILAMPAAWWAMSEPEIGRAEHFAIEAATGSGAETVTDETGVIAAVERVVEAGGIVLADGVHGWEVRIHLTPDAVKRFMLDDDRDFDAALEDPRQAAITHVLAPDPQEALDDRIEDAYPGAWHGKADEFELAADFPHTNRKWRLLRVVSEPSQ